MDFIRAHPIFVSLFWYEKVTLLFALFYPVLGVLMARRRLASGRGSVVALATLPLTAGAVVFWLGLPDLIPRDPDRDSRDVGRNPRNAYGDPRDVDWDSRDASRNPRDVGPDPRDVDLDSRGVNSNPHAVDPDPHAADWKPRHAGLQVSPAFLTHSQGYERKKQDFSSSPS